MPPGAGPRKGARAPGCVGVGSWVGPGVAGVLGAGSWPARWGPGCKTSNSDGGGGPPGGPGGDAEGGKTGGPRGPLFRLQPESSGWTGGFRGPTPGSFSVVEGWGPGTRWGSFLVFLWGPPPGPARAAPPLLAPPPPSSVAGGLAALVSVTAGERMTLRVEDDGIGIADEPKLGNGIVNVRRRAEELGGSCELTTSPDGGTIFEWSVPMPSAGQ